MPRALLLAFFLLFAPASGASAQALSKPQEEQVRAIVRDYLITNPEVIEEALEALEKKRALDRSRRIAGDPRHFSLGPRNARFTLVEFFDYQCGFCHQAADWVFATARKRSDVRVVFVEYPILGEVSEEASRAAIASLKQGKYAEFHRALMASRGRMTSKTIDDAARKSGIDVARMRRDMRDAGVDRLIADNRALGQQWAVNGTPAFMVNGEFTHGADLAALDEAMTVGGPKRSR